VKRLFPPSCISPGEIERALFKKGVVEIAGVDEAGRGALCGPVTAAAVVLRAGTQIEGLNDSKKVPPHRRELLAQRIRSDAVAWAVAEAGPDEIDASDILRATFLAMRRALGALVASLGHAPELVLVDGPLAIEKLELPQKPVVKGDCLSANVAAASILAKTSRDARMVELSRSWPGWDLDVHKGYGTRRHFEIIRARGLLPMHRRSFVR